MLLQRTYPEVSDSTQSKPIFIPDFFIPKCTGFLDGSLEDYLKRIDYSNLLDKKEKQIEKDTVKGRDMNNGKKLFK